MAQPSLIVLADKQNPKFFAPKSADILNLLRPCSKNVRTTSSVLVRKMSTLDNLFHPYYGRLFLTAP